MSADDTLFSTNNTAHFRENWHSPKAWVPFEYQPFKNPNPKEERHGPLYWHRRSPVKLHLCRTKRRGKLLRTDTIATHADSVREYLQLIPGTKHVAIEEGTQAQWLYEVLSGRVAEFLVLNVDKSTGNKSDQLDAVRLAERIRTGDIGNPNKKAPAALTRLRDLARVYEMINQESGKKIHRRAPQRLAAKQHQG